ncbi:MAG: transglutaminase-like putative cysteine protease [Mariniblastus sp.]|jgi:transglutaminase-like putative cysteine protease
MNNRFTLLTLLAIAITFQFGCEQPTDLNASDANDAILKEDTAIESRSFELRYGATIKDVPDGATVRVWFPIAESNGQQTVTLAATQTPAVMQTNRDKVYGNGIGYFQVDDASVSKLDFELTYDVKRLEAQVDSAAAELTEAEKQRFLSANSLVPLTGKPQELLGETEIPADPAMAGEAIYEFVERHMTYDKSQPGYGNGDAVWACDSKTGNCTDFHSLFISMARSQSIPARFEIGFPLPTDKTAGKIGGYHCWAWFHIEGKGWSPVDISEADKHPEMKDYYFGKLTEDRVSFSTGRDIVLVPESAGEPLNYFVYPYVEVDGKPWPKDKIALDFGFSDQAK